MTFYRCICLAFAIVFAITNDAPAQKDASSKPNVIIIYADDLGYGDLGCYGATHVRTPNIDRLAEEGMRFTDAHTVSAVCTPSRYALLTGTYPARNGLAGAVFSRQPLLIDTNKLTIADLMQDNGYATACIGKWHLGFGNVTPVDWNARLDPGPLELGFDYYFGVPVLNSHPPFVYVRNHSVVGLEEDDPLVYGAEALTIPYPEKWNRGLHKVGGAQEAHQLYIDSLVGTTLKDEAIAWIKKHRDEPFFLYLATTNIHHPFTPARRFRGTSDAGIYGDFIHELDWIVGEIARTLALEGMEDNTLIILTSDNGGMLNRGGQDAYARGHRMNGELLGFKFDAWEGGHRIPFIAKWPGVVEAGSISEQLIGNIDMLATLASIMHAKLPDDQAVDSYNLLPVLTGEADKPIRKELLIAPNNLNNIALRSGKWMYISGQGGGGFGSPQEGSHTFGGPGAFPFTDQQNSDIEGGKLRKDAPPAQLYDLDTDLDETYNLYETHTNVAERLQKRIDEILQSASTRID